MKRLTSQHANRAGWKSALLLTTALALFASTPARAQLLNRASSARGQVVRPDANYQGKSYAKWSAEWWQWDMELPLAGHPSIDSPDFDVRAGQHGNVWFLGAPFGTVERTCTIPKNKALFVALLNAEASSLEESPFFGATEADQRAAAKDLADHIITATLFCTVDGVPVSHLESYRASSPQFRFTAPTPWVFGATGGHGTSVGDGYYVLIEPLSKGNHTIHYGGLIRFTLAEDGFDADLPIDMTYHVQVR